MARRAVRTTGRTSKERPTVGPLDVSTVENKPKRARPPGAEGEPGPAGRPGVNLLPYAWPFVATATIAVLAGGLVAAAAGEVPTRHLSWAAAYLVLVWGLGQAFLGAGQFIFGRPSVRLLAWQFATFNVGSAAVLGGVLGGIVPVLDEGSVMLLCSLGLFAWGTRMSPDRHLSLIGYRVVVALLALSVPAGAVLAR